MLWIDLLMCSRCGGLPRLLDLVRDSAGGPPEAALPFACDRLGDSDTHPTARKPQ